MSLSSSLLDNDGLSVDSRFPRTSAQAAAFVGMESEKQMWDSVVSLHEDDEKRRERFHKCGLTCQVMKNVVTGETRLGSQWCEYRTCPHCRRAYQRTTGARMAKWVGVPKENRVRFITLTLSHTDLPLGMQFAFARQAFRRLRQTDVWKYCGENPDGTRRQGQQCGRGVFEVTWNKETKQWHPHLHVIAVGNFIDKRKLSAAWEKATGGSRIVDVKLLQTSRKVANYVAKYLGKPPDFGEDGDTLALMGEYYLALRGRRMIISYGGVGPLPELDSDDDSDAEGGNWVRIGDYNDIFRKAKTGDPESMKIMDALARGRAKPPAT